MQQLPKTKTWLVEVLYTCVYSAVATACAYALLRYLGVSYWPFYAILGVWVCLEILFFAVQRLRYHRFNRVNRNRPDAQDIEQRFQNFLTLSPILDIRDFISGWFLNIPFDQIRKENVADFIAYAYWYRPRHELTSEEQQRVGRYTEQIASSWNVKFPEGSNEDLQLMGHLWEPLKVVHKPLFVHVAAEMSVLLTHLALLALNFERYECMGFTYWASRLETPIADGEAPVAGGRLSVLQSVLADIQSLLQSDGELPAARGPLDFFNTQGFAEYQQRLKDSLAAIMPPPAFTDSLPVLPDFAAGFAALSERLPAMPSMPTMPAMPSMPTMPAMPYIASLPRLPSMAELSLSSQGSTGITVELPQGHRRSGSALGTLRAFPSISDLSQLPAFRDLDEMGHFDDLLGPSGSSVSLPGFNSAAAAALAAASAARGSFGTFPVFSFGTALRESFRGHLHAAQSTLAAALPVMNLPDWHLPDWNVHAAQVGPAHTWQQRLGAAITRTVEWAELDAMFAGLYDPPLAGPSLAADAPGAPAHRSAATADLPAASSAFTSPPMVSATAPGIIQEWVETARATLGRSVARFSGFSLPAPSELLDMWPQERLTGQSCTEGGPAAAVAVDPDAAAALRRRVEGSIIKRSASSASLDPTPSNGLKEQSTPRTPCARHSGAIPATSRAPGPSAGPRSQQATALLRQKELRRRVLGDRRGHRRTLSDPGLIFSSRTEIPTARVLPEPDTASSSAMSQHTNGKSTGVRGSPDRPACSQAEDRAVSKQSAAEAGAEQVPVVGPCMPPRHSFDVLLTPPRASGRSLREPSTEPCGVSQRQLSPVPVSRLSVGRSVDSGARLPLPQTAASKRAPLFPAQASPAASREASLSHAAGTADLAPEPSATLSGAAGRDEAGARAPASGQHANSSPGSKEPIVFLHGVGFGVFPYLGFVWKLLRAFPGRPFVLLEVRSVSLRLCMRAVGVDDVVRALAAVLRRHRVTSANFVGHSFGTFVVAHMRKLFPEAVSSVLLCDPVCMLTCFPKLLYNFIYRGFSIRDVLDNPAEAARWLAARDLTIAATFCRHFWWHTLMLWPWELPDKSVLVLSTKDALVPSELVKKQLRAGGVDWESGGKVKVLEREVYHGHFLFMPKWQDTIVETFRIALLEREGHHDDGNNASAPEMAPEGPGCQAM